VPLDPRRPSSLHLRRGQLVELGWKPARQLGQNRQGFAETSEPGRSDGDRARGEEQQDADNPNVSVRNESILRFVPSRHKVSVDEEMGSACFVAGLSPFRPRAGQAADDYASLSRTAARVRGAPRAPTVWMQIRRRSGHESSYAFCV